MSMDSDRRRNRFPRTASFRKTPLNRSAGIVGGLIGLFLGAAFLDMFLCEIEEDLKPEEVCKFCSWSAGIPNRFPPGCGYHGPANRFCPACNREWSDFKPYYLKWLRGPIRSCFGQFTF